MTLSSSSVDSSFVPVGTAQVLPLSHPSSVASPSSISTPTLWRLSTHNVSSIDTILWSFPPMSWFLFPPHVYDQSPDTTDGIHIHGRHFIDACGGGARVQYPWGEPPWGLQEVRPLVDPNLAALLFLRCATYIAVSLMDFLRQSCATVPLPCPNSLSPSAPLARADSRFGSNCRLA
jgi:hypothetical protein